MLYLLQLLNHGRIEAQHAVDVVYLVGQHAHAECGVVGSVHLITISLAAPAGLLAQEVGVKQRHRVCSILYDWVTRLRKLLGGLRERLVDLKLVVRCDKL